MTKGQKIIGSLLVVVAVGLMLNLSRGVRAQDLWGDDHFEQVIALEDLRFAVTQAAQAIIDAQARAKRAADSRARRAEDAADLRQRTAAMEADALRSRQAPRSSAGSASSSGLTGRVAAIDYKLDRLREAIEAERLQAATQRDWVRKRLVRLRQIIEQRLGLPPSAFVPRGPGVVGTRPGHPDTIVQDEAVRIEGMRKFFDELRAAEEQKEAQLDD